MITILPDGEHRSRIVGPDGRDRGWIRGRAIRFTGFASESQLMDAAKAAWNALESVLRGQPTGRAAWLPRLDGLRLVHDGAYEWISDGRIPIARVFRPQEQDGGFAIELLVPSYAPDGTAMKAATTIAGALEAMEGIAIEALSGGTRRSTPPPAA